MCVCILIGIGSLVAGAVLASDDEGRYVCLGEGGGDGSVELRALLVADLPAAVVDDVFIPPPWYDPSAEGEETAVKE